MLAPQPPLTLPLSGSPVWYLYQEKAVESVTLAPLAGEDKAVLAGRPEPQPKSQPLLKQGLQFPVGHSIPQVIFSQALALQPPKPEHSSHFGPQVELLPPFPEGGAGVLVG